MVWKMVGLEVVGLWRVGLSSIRPENEMDLPETV